MKSHSVQKGKSLEKECVRVMLKCKLQNLSSKSVINSVHDLNMIFMVCLHINLGTWSKIGVQFQILIEHLER